MDRSAFLTELHGRFAVPREVLVELVERLSAGRVVATQRLISGDENEVHRVELADGSVVYPRIGIPGTPAGKSRWEAWAMERARAAGVPVPEVLAVEPIGTERYAMVVSAAPGRPLAAVRPSLPDADYLEVMTDLGRVLARLHSVYMPGAGVPDDDETWPDPATHRRRYLANRLADCEQLGTAGLTGDETARVKALFNDAPDFPVSDHPVLCHGDLGPEHIFVDSDLRVCGLIDWGMWNAGSAVGDLAAAAISHDEAGLAALIAGHNAGSPTDPAFWRAIRCSLIAHLVGNIGWYVASGQTAMLAPAGTALRRVLTGHPSPT
jgi:aminoglycoside phosphotransferase (APT) family kinase protein